MNPKESTSLVDIVAPLVKRRRGIAMTVAVVFALSTIVSLLLPRWYESTSTLLPPDTSSSQLDVAGILQSVGIIQPAQLPTMASPSDVYKAILESQTVRNAVIDTFDLVSVYKAKIRQKALKKLAKHTHVEVTDEGLIRIAVEDRSPQRAADMANAHVRLLNEYNVGSLSGRARRTREFVESRLQETEEELRGAEEALRDFQETTGAVALPEQAVVSIETAAELWKGITELEVALAATAGFESPQSPRVVRLRSQVAELQNRLAILEGTPERTEADSGSSDTISSSSVFVGLREAPALAVRYGRLLRDVEIQKTVYTFLTRQYEEAKIQERRDTPTVQVLDVGVPAEIAARPKKKVVVAAATGVALFFALIWCFVLERWESLRTGNAPEAARWTEMGRLLAGDLARFRNRAKGRRDRTP